MREEELKVYRAIPREHHAPEAYRPWINRMGAGDRMAVDGQTAPALPELEWKFSQDDLWIGRLKKST